jgi:uncharacterized membrane protein SpoIIM required for sporulation
VLVSSAIEALGTMTMVIAITVMTASKHSDRLVLNFLFSRSRVILFIVAFLVGLLVRSSAAAWEPYDAFEATQVFSKIAGAKRALLKPLRAETRLHVAVGVGFLLAACRQGERLFWQEERT